MAELSEYERIRLNNIEENRRMLCQLGLLSEDWKPPVHKKQVFVKKPVIRKKKKIENGDPLYLPGRRSLRASYSNDTDDSDITDSINGEYSGSENGTQKTKYEKLPKRPNTYGEIEGVEVGEMWETRMECSRAGIHRPTVAGIHPGPEGAYSIALSGGYEDNYDGGDSFTYTGAGGRDLKGTKANPKNLRTGPQVRDQTLDGANGSLATSVETRKPVRVIRGYKSSSAYAPESGYRYDGLYQVENYWTAKGLSGHLVYKFALKRCPDQAPPSWTTADDCNSSIVEEDPDKSTTGSSDELANTLNPFVKMGKKLSVEDLHQDVEAESDISGTAVNGKVFSPKKQHTKRISDSLEVDSELVVSIKAGTPEKLENKTIDSVKKSPKKLISKNSPIKNKNSTPVKEKLYKSPVKMIASNQSIDDSSLVAVDFNHDSVNEVRSKLNNSTCNLSAMEECSYADLSDNNKGLPENRKLIQTNTSPDIFDGGSPSYLKSGRRSHEDAYNSGKNRGMKRSPSPDDFGKICDELCNELPKIEKVKRIRFSFDNLTDNDLQLNTSKVKRKRSYRTPRKSSLIVNKDQKSSDNCEQKSQDLIFSKYIELFLANLSSSNDDYLGWDDYSSEFKGWTDKDVTDAKKYTSTFSDFIFKCNENSSFSSSCDENGWAGWEDVSRRSLVLNGFLLEEISRNRKSFDSDGTDVPEDFLGFQPDDKRVVA